MTVKAESVKAESVGADAVRARAVGQRSGGGAGPAPSCAATLTTDYVGAFGLNPAQIDGQRIFIESAGQNGQYAATTDINNPTPLWQSGTRWIEMQDLQPPSTGIPFVSFVSPDGSAIFDLYWEQLVSEWTWEVTENQSVIGSVSVSGSDTDNVGLGISANGDLRAIRNNNEVSLTAAFEGFWSSDVALYTRLALNEGDGGSLLIATDGSNYNNDFSGISGTNQDWCGNAIPAVESGTIQSDGTTATMTFSTTMEADNPAAGWTIEADGSPVALSSASLSGDLLTVELGETISSTATVTTSYDDSTGTMESTDGISLSSITSLGMTNNA